MAGVPETRSTFDDMLKYVYEDAIIQATREQSALMMKLETITPKAHFGGKSITFPVLYNSQGSVGSAAETDSLPASLPGNFDNAVIPITYHYFGCTVTGQTIGTSQTSQDAFANAWTLETQIKVRAFRQMINRQLCGDGKGILAQQDGAVNGQAITVDNAGGWSGYKASHVNGAQFLSPNMYIQVRDSGGTVEDAGLKISGITTPGNFESSVSAIITVVGTCSSCADGSYLYPAFSTTASNDAYLHEGAGIKLLIDDSTVATSVQGIDGSVNNEWNSVVKYGSNSGTAEAITSLRLMEAIAEIQVGSGGKVDFIVTSPGVWLALGALADESNQIMNAKTIELGYPSFEIMGIPVFQDPYCADELYLIDNRALAIYETGPAGWLDPMNTGNYIRIRSGASTVYDQVEANWRWYMNLGIKNRAWCAKIQDITVSGRFMLKV